jgi:hypothetical protein
LGAILLAAPGSSAGPEQGDGARIFRERIAPLLIAECYRCHSAKAEKLKAGLRLDSRAGLLAGGDSGPAAIPGRGAESLLVRALRHEDDLAMPKGRPKLAEQITTSFVQWIDAGAPYAAAIESQPGIDSSQTEARKHWAFQPVRAVPVPPVADSAWVLNPIDSFVLARLEKAGWHPARAATRAEWLRRVTFDLIGLPPRPEEIRSFEADCSSDAYERVVDRLLASHLYGEHWAQHWLDLVRYAETEGFEYDRPIPGAWRYRDYVIAALDRDKPFDRFIVEQIAGDEIAPSDQECQTASVFHRLGPVRRNAGNPEIAISRNEVLTERTDIIGTVFLGLTVGCARCHNHKLEPISQKDYYRLQAYLAATHEHNISLASPAEQKAWADLSRRVERGIATLTKVRRKAAASQKQRISQEIAKLEDSLHSPPATIPATWNDEKQRTAVHVLARGVWESKGEAVGPRPPSILVPAGLRELPADVRDPRTRLARWLTSADHPLTARVLANRIWQRHFGAGLLRTASDFGTHGDRPSHPELLDWLATRLIAGGWRVKPLHRLLVLSNTYRQSSRPDSAAVVQLDPENRLLARYSRRRLSAEEIRDAMLAVSGRLNPKRGGPSVMVPVDPEIVALLNKPGQWQVAKDPAEFDRRSIYLHAKRNLRLSFMESFDAPALQTSCPRRESTTHAPQALELLNGRLSNDLAESFARRLEDETGGVPEQVVHRAYALATGRAPTPEELRLSLDFVRDQPRKEFALAIFNLNGFLYVQ